MQKCLILAESGGTKTDWKVWQEGKLIHSFCTGTFHPDFVADIHIQEVFDRLPQLQSEDTLLRIYSAGCFRDEGKLKLKEKLSFFSAKVEIKSDIDAAVEATGLKEGWVCILGTGSVLAYFNNGTIQLFGGLGWDKGDEGSGFYFGKLVVEALSIGLLFSGISSKEASELIALKGDKTSKYRYASLSKQISISESIFYHELNVQLFISRYLVSNKVEKITVIGGYAKAIEAILIAKLLANNVIVNEIIDRPIDRL